MHGQLRSFGDELAACGDVAQLLDVVAARAAAVIGEGSVLTVVSDDGTMLVPAAFHHDDPDVLAAMREVLGEPYPVTEGFAGRVVDSRQPLVLHAAPATVVADNIAASSRPFAQRYPIHSLMIVPMAGYGEIVGTLGVVRVASEQPYSDEALFALEALAERAALAIAEARRSPHRLGATDFEAMFRHNIDGVLFTQPDGRILAANPAACQILRRSERDICRAGRAGIVVDDDRTRAAVASRAETGYARAELTMRRGDGTHFVADVASTAFTNEAGEVRACVTFRDVSDQVALRVDLEEKTRLLSRTAREDDLTGLRNRRAFIADATHALAIADRDGVPAQIVFFDLDGLKRINDAHGHEAGDQALRTLAAALVAESRASDVTARLGGDEFVALLHGASAHDAETTVQRIAAACHAASSSANAVTFSYGMVERASGSATSLDHLVHEADQRMYERKARTRAADGADPGDD